MKENPNNSFIYKSESNFEIIDYEYQKANKINESKNNSSNFYIIKEGKKKLKARYYICSSCHSSPKIIFICNNLLHIKCDCIKYINIRTNDFIECYTNHENKDIIKHYLCCKYHNDCKYIYYCLDCKVNFCEECLNKNKLHENHSKENLLLIDDKLNEVKRLVKNIRKKLPKGDIEYRKILNIIEAFVKKYKEYPSHNLYRSIFKAKEFLSTINIPLITEKIKITTKEELFNYNKHNSNLISSIKINNQNFSDLSIFKQLNLENLQKLQLQGNNIKSIEPLLHCNFKKLKYLDLENNKLNDESVKDFDKFNFKDIRYINLYANEIKSPEIFEKIINYHTLKTFFVGSNLFDEKEIKKNINNKYDLTHLKKIGVTGNFTDKTINFLSNLKFLKLEKLYISRNNLSSLSFLKNIFCENLVSLWAINNNLTDYNDILNLPFKDKIKKINLKNNKINNIDNLLKFVKDFPKLKELVLINNPIDLESPINKKIIKEIKKKNIDISVGSSKVKS